MQKLTVVIILILLWIAAAKMDEILLPILAEREQAAVRINNH